jgi:predicted transcriptional regulator
VTLPLDSRVDAAARKLHVSRSLLLREAIARGLQPAPDFLRREERPEAPAGNEL